MLNIILREKMETEHISVREVARQTGVAHTTIHRILRGERIDLATIEKICKWLMVDPVYVINLSNNQWLFKLGMIIESNPELLSRMRSIFMTLDQGQISSEQIRQICTYISFILKISCNE